MIAFKPDVEKVKMARDHVGKIAADWPIDDYVVRVVASELVGNSIRHAGTDEIRVDAHADGAAYRLTVWDGDGTLPVPRDPGPDALSGRGLLLVAELVSRWGVVLDGTGGKTVFAEWDVPCPRDRPPAEVTFNETEAPR